MALAEKQIWDQWKKIEDRDMNPLSCTNLIFDKGVKNIWWRKDSLFNVGGKTGYLHAENWNWIHVCNPIQVKTQSGLL
jgi:hypothetical protein